MVAEPLAGDLGVVEGDDAIGEDLVGVAALAGDQHGVAGAGVGQRGLDGLAAVGLDADLARPPEAGQELVEDPVGVLGAGIAEW